MVVPGAINKDKKPVAASSTAVASTANNCPAIVVSAESETGRNSATGVTDNTAGWEQEAAAAQPFNWDDDEVGAAATGEEEQLHRAHTRRSCWSMPAWLISGMLRVAVLALLLAPGAVEIALAYVHDDTMYQPLSVSSYALGGYTLVFWSLFAGTAYIVLLSCRLFVYVAPAILIKLAVWTTGSVPRRFDLVLGYVADLHRYISTCIFLVLLTAVFQEVFRPDVNRLGTNSWRPIMFNVISCMLVTSIMINVEKLAVQAIAVRFHRAAFHDRIKSANFESDLINRLNRESRRILKLRQRIIHEAEVAAVRSMRARSASKVHKKRSSALGGEHTSVDDAAKEQRMPSSFMQKLGGHTDKHQRSRSFDPSVPTFIISSEVSPPKEALVVPTVDEVTQASNEEISTSVDQLVSAESPFYPGKASHDARDADHSDHETEHRRWYNRIPFGKHSKTIHHGHTANEDDDRSNASISDQSSLNAKHGSHRFSKLARELATGLDANSPKDAKKVARRIFEALSPNTAALLKASAQRVVVDEELIDMAKYGFSASLSLQNFAPAFATMAEAEKAFALFDRDANGSITPQEMKETVVGIFKDRKALSASLRDVGSAVGKLDSVMYTGALVISLLLCLLIFGVAIGPFLVTSMSMIIAVTFIIGNSAKNLFEGIIFLFVTHPFDCGDRVVIDNQTLVVKELGILTTVFQLWNGQIVYMPNSVLATKQIANFRRSPNQTEVVEFHVAFNTPMEKLLALRHRLTEFLHAESREFVPRIELLPYEIENVNKIKIQLHVEHRFNWQDSDRRIARRTKFNFFLRDAILDLGIQYAHPVQELNLQSTSTENARVL